MGVAFGCRAYVCFCCPHRRSSAQFEFKLLLFDFWEYKNNPVGFLNSRISTSVIDCRPGPSLTSLVAPRLFEIYRNSGDSRMGRTCRLVCREWARECPLRDPMDCDWRFDNGVVRRWVGTEWQVLPTKFWVWKLVERAFYRGWCPKVITVRLLHL